MSINNYCGFWDIVETPHTYLLIYIVVLVICILYIYRSIKPSNRKRSIAFVFLCFWIDVVLSSTILFRPKLEIYDYSFEIFKGYRKWSLYSFSDYFVNVFMFIPFGFCIGVLVKHRRILLSICVGFFFSLLIEVTQLSTSRGNFDVDDLIHNTLGCVIGYWLVGMKIFSGTNNNKHV